MKYLRPRKSFTFIAALLILVFGNAISASAATVTSITATTNTGLVYNTANSSPITITFDLPRALSTGTANSRNNGFQVTLSNVASSTFVDSTPCSPSQISFTSNQAGALFFWCQVYFDVSGNPVIQMLSDTAFSLGKTFTLTLPAGSLTMAASGNLGVAVSVGDFDGMSLTSIDSGTTSLNVGPSGSTVTFDANDGSGNTTQQVGATAANLTLNPFTRPGYVFLGWSNSRTDASNQLTSYRDGASYNFASAGTRTLYASWERDLNGSSQNSGSGSSSNSSNGSTNTNPNTLATTGQNLIPLGLGGLLLVFSGISLVSGVVARKRRLN